MCEMKTLSRMTFTSVEMDAFVLAWQYAFRVIQRPYPQTLSPARTSKPNPTPGACRGAYFAYASVFSSSGSRLLYSRAALVIHACQPFAQHLQ